jgi:phosphate transport system substrate-binding protein
MNTTLKFAVGSLIGATAISFSLGALAQDITGAGATFPAPLYAKWASEYNKATGIKVNYQSVGSGAGIKQIDSKTVAFGASDMPLKDDELAKKGQIQFPTVIGGVVPVVNIKGIAPASSSSRARCWATSTWARSPSGAIRPSRRSTLAWRCPTQTIAPVRRADGSGTSFIFTNYLSKVNAEWKGKVGEGTAVNWPAGAGGKGNEGVAAFVGRLPNSIGYVEYAYVKQNKMTYAQMQNS